jgi:hypothetical protein
MNIGLRVHSTLARKELGLRFFRPIHETL